MFALAVVFAVFAGMGAIAYLGWRADPENRFRKTLKQIRSLPEHVRREEKV